MAQGSFRVNGKKSKVRLQHYTLCFRNAPIKMYINLLVAFTLWAFS